MRPLADIRIVSIEQYGAGPFGSLHLADLGADVIKIEDPTSGGDVSRYIPPYQDGEDSLFYQSLNRNKRSLGLDLRTPAGRRVFEDLVRTADAVYSNLRGDVPERLGIRYADLRQVNHRIVCVSLSGFGMTGPRRDQPGYDYLLQGLTGWMSLTGEPDGPPTKSGLSLVDFAGGVVGALSLLAAVHAARRDDRGMDCDLSLYDVATSMLTYDAAWHLNADWQPRRLSRSAHPSLVPFQLFQGSDRRWFVVACAKEKFWKALTVALGEPELADDPRFVDFGSRRDNRQPLIEHLDRTFAGAEAAEWIGRLEDAGVPVAAVRTVTEAMNDEHTAARDLVVTTSHETRGVVRTVRTAARVGTDAPASRRAPRRGEDHIDILADLGYSDRTIGELERAGAFG